MSPSPSEHPHNTETGTNVGSQRHRIVVISAPSGAGKTTIARALLRRHDNWRFSVSATTRPKRATEIHGDDYWFLDGTAFQKEIDDGNVVEWEEIFGWRYGTLRSEIDRLLSDPDVDRVIFDVDVKGALSIQRAFPEETFLIFIAPPSLDVLKRRLADRRTESEEGLRVRLERASLEMDEQDRFDLVVVNDDVDRAVARIERELVNE
jgi:guanylate kinase